MADQNSSTPASRLFWLCMSGATVYALIAIASWSI